MKGKKKVLSKNINRKIKKTLKKSFLLVANWKMNPQTLKEAKDLASKYERKAKDSQKVGIIICPPSVFLSQISGIKINGEKNNKFCFFGAQDIDLSKKESCTGSINAEQYKSAGADYVIIGHSERRKAGDTDEKVIEKVQEALNLEMKVILCVGENERDSNAVYLKTIREQILSVISSVDKKKVDQIIIAYEPVWAIGKSYDTALSPADIHGMSIFIKKVVAEALGKDTGLSTQVLYGGSVNFENAQSIISDGEIDGLLIGRQSLNPENFIKIIDYANSI